jgi:hypothetical protein
MPNPAPTIRKTSGSVGRTWNSRLASNRVVASAHRVEEGTARVARGFFRLLDTAQAEARFPPRLVGRHAPSHVVVGEHLDVRAQFLVEG